eukprot:2352430-Prymnesium_polylepis.3
MSGVSCAVRGPFCVLSFVSLTLGPARVGLRGEYPGGEGVAWRNGPQPLWVNVHTHTVHA